ncbi:MAG: helix-turn-helix transcriptional regulator [Rhodobacteraceae bacterium]|nr:helix-turn-helix transcriptional regulator [Paracoccaceae bacterium]
MNSAELERRCPVEIALEIVGGKWKPLIMWRLSRGALRFGQLQRIAPQISQRMLTLHLRELERDGLIERKVFPEVPPRVEYSLTPVGQRMLPVLGSLGEWLVANHRDLRPRRRTRLRRPDAVRRTTKNPRRSPWRVCAGPGGRPLR